MSYDVYEPFEPGGWGDCEAAVEASPEQIGQWLSDLSDPNAGVREEAARRLSLCTDTEAVQGLLDRLAAEDVGLSSRAGDILVQMGYAAVDAVSELVESPSGHIRKLAIDLLALMPAHHLSDRLARRVMDEAGNVRLAAIDALGALNAVEHADVVREAFYMDPPARPHVLGVLGRMGRPEDLPLLVNALTDEDPVVSLCAAEALAADGGPDVLGLLSAKLEESDPMARPIVLQAVVGVCERHPEARGRLTLVVRDELLGMLDDPDEDYRRVAARGLRFFADEASVQGLLAHSGNDDLIDMAALEVLSAVSSPLDVLVVSHAEGIVTTQAALTFALALLAKRTISTERYGEAADFIGLHFGSLDAETKLSMLSVISRLGIEELNPALEAAASDADPTVSSYACDLIQGG